MRVFNKNKNEIVTTKEEYNLTENVKVADVKQYLQDEYKRAYERETIIKRLENRIIFLEEEKVKYDALLVISDENRTRLLNKESEIKELKNIISELKENIKALKNTNTNIELNSIKILKEKDEEIKLLKKELKKFKPKEGKK